MSVNQNWERTGIDIECFEQGLLSVVQRRFPEIRILFIYETH